MHQRLKTILDAAVPEALAEVAAAALGISTAEPGPPTYEEILKPHADARTIGIIRVSGTARVPGESVARPWSAVTKLIDLAVPNSIDTPVDPRNEVHVYEKRHFAGTAGGLRPARCYHISRPSETLIVLWLEDLTSASGPPFTVDQLMEMARHLGTWNAMMAANPPMLDFPLGRDFQVTSFEQWTPAARAADMVRLRAEPMVREIYARRPVEIVVEYVAAYGWIVERSKTLPHALSLADCPASNFFHRPGETIAIDWAGLGSEPVGADGGRFLGSAMTFGRDFTEVVRAEREVFESYLTGLREGGATEDRKVVRAGYLSELCFYLCTLLVLPTMLANERGTVTRAYFEKRFGMPMAEVGPAIAPAVDLVPSYIAEIEELVA